MRIKRVRRSGPSFWSDTTKWIRSRRGFLQFLLAAIIGFAAAASIGISYKLGAWRAVERPIRALFTKTRDTAQADLVTNDLPTLYFDVGFIEYQAMAAQREEALQKGVLLLGDDDWMQAQIRFQDKTIPVRIRLKGDWLDHLGDNKWSFRVKTRGDAVLLGMRSFSVQSPHTRGYLNEWLYLSELRRADILAPRYSFVNLVMNGDSWGVYALEESFSKELFESQGRREGVIVRFDESLLWERNSWAPEEQRWTGWDPASTFESRAFAEVDEFNTTQIQSDPLLKEQSATALGLLRGLQNQQLTPSQVFDVDTMGRYLAYTTLWDAGHSLVWINERFYYNPLTTRLEPIGYDALPFMLEGFRTGLAQYDDLPIMESYAREVQRIARTEHVEELKTLYGEELERYRQALLQEFAPADLEPPWDKLAERQAMLAPVFTNQVQPVYAYQVGADPGAIVDVQVGNILKYPVILSQLQHAGRAVDITASWVDKADRDLLRTEAEPRVILRQAHEVSPRYVTLHIPAEVIQDLSLTGTVLCTDTLQLVTNLVGVEEPYIVSVRRDYPPILTAPVLPTQPTVEQAIARHPFLTISEEQGFLELKPGEWDVAGDLVLPQGYGLFAEGPVTLRFDEGAILYATGPLQLAGTAQAPICLLPKGESWAGVIVLQAGEEVRSSLEHVEIRGTQGIHRDGWMTTGGVTFYKSPVTLSHCLLQGSLAEDALNIIHSDFELAQTEFCDTSSDAFDGDFCRGAIVDCTFHDVRGDAIDVSGSHITVEDVDLLRIADKGISAGEGSVVEIKHMQARDVAIAIASKDMSQVIVQDIAIARASIAGLAAYVKKTEYGTASIRASAVVFRDDSKRTLAQIGSSITVNGKAALPVELDVDALYVQLEALVGMKALDYQFGPSIRLTGHYLATPQLKAGDDIRFVLRWETKDSLDQDYSIFVHILDALGQTVAQHDNMPVNDSMPTSKWPVGESIVDAHVVRLPPDTPAGEYRIIVGMYLYQTGERLPIYRASGEAVPGSALALEQVVVTDN